MNMLESKKYSEYEIIEFTLNVCANCERMYDCDIFETEENMSKCMEKGECVF